MNGMVGSSLGFLFATYPRLDAGEIESHKHQRSQQKFSKSLLSLAKT